MAAILSRSRTFLTLDTALCNNLARSISTSSTCQDLSEGWLSKLLVRKIEPTKEPHSRMLSDKEKIYELQTHNIRPGYIDKYLANYKKGVELIQSKPELSLELIGSWTVLVGDQDQALHLWRYTGGYSKIDNAKNVSRTDKDWIKIQQERAECLRARHLQYLLRFDYWPKIESRSGGNIYEIRSYALKPGTMIEWGNNWNRGINYRKRFNEAYAGFFSQIGRLYNVHHIWCFKDFEQRKEARENAWRSPGWDECVAYTVPLIREMQSRILEPTQFSPTQ